MRNSNGALLKYAHMDMRGDKAPLAAIVPVGPERYLLTIKDSRNRFYFPTEEGAKAAFAILVSAGMGC